MSSSGSNKTSGKRRISGTSRIMQSLGGKRKQTSKDLISTANKPTETADDIFSDVEASIDESIIRSPISYSDEAFAAAAVKGAGSAYPNYDPNPISIFEGEAEAAAASATAATETSMEVDTRTPAVVFVRPPTLNQIGALPDNVRDIQMSINIIKLYMDALQHNIAPAYMSVKDHFTMVEQQTNKLAYKDIMYSILNNNTVHKRNFYAVSNLFYYYFVKLFDNTVPIAHVIVNVNYTRGKTNISHAITAFFNSCAHYVVSNIKQLFNAEQQSMNIPGEYYRIIQNNQITLTNLYNFRLNDLRSVLFLKHTPDNDNNTFASKRADNCEERVINVPIHVMINVPQLYFE
ncbi:asb114 [Agrotis segetum nucleopolyhedrovirus B]|uniref:Asb114 n=1 Tax=Agrotis segetum nucleopolyhedrovirus B TaxID=1580580 RepID=A0A0A7KTH1_9ABAC|nr:asb114 [Agrotis segetum nucleopolyhedrovirus B]AIZ48671.1 asb114 [Agrotis segetum nucleopolyhedrovirus B]